MRELHQINATLPIPRRGIKKVERIALPKGTEAVSFLSFQLRGLAQQMRAPKLYYGAGAAGENTEAFILSLPSKPAESAVGIFSSSPGALEKAYFALPASFRGATAYISNMPGWFLSPSTVSVSDPETGYTEGYLLYESISLALGSIQVFIEQA